MSTLSRLNNTLHQLNAARVCYCILRDGQSLSELSDGGEVDIIVAPEHMEQLHQTLLASDFHSIPAAPVAGDSVDRNHHFYYQCDPQTGSQLTLDIISQLRFEHKRQLELPALASRLLANRRLVDGRYIADGDEALLATLLHELLDKPQPRREKLNTIIDQITHRGVDAFLTTTAHYLPAAGTKLIGRIIRRGQYSRADKFLLIARMWAVSPRQFAIRKQWKKEWHAFMDRCWYRRLGRRQYYLSVYGPDGVGKSTVCTLVQQHMSPPRTKITPVYAGRPKTKTARLANNLVKSCYLLSETLRYLLAGSAPTAQSSTPSTTPSTWKDMTYLAEIRSIMWRLSLYGLASRLTGPYLQEIFLLDRGVLDEYSRITQPRIRERAEQLLATSSLMCAAGVLLKDTPARIINRKQERSINELQIIYRQLQQACDELRATLSVDIIRCDGLTEKDVAQQVQQSVLATLSSRCL